MFEVGKKYCYTTYNIAHPDIYECVFVGKEWIILRNDGEEVCEQTDCDYLVEYKEPVKHVRYLLWMLSKNNKVSCTVWETAYERDESLEYQVSEGRKLLRREEVEYIEE